MTKKCEGNLLRGVSSAWRYTGWALLLSAFIGCSHVPSQRSADSASAESLDEFNNGTLRLLCETTCVIRWNANSRHLKALHDSKVWLDLAKEVSRIDYPTDLSYYYLGRAAEGLGRPEAAAIYYRLAMSHLHRCQRWSTDCDGFDFPKDIRVRLAGLPASKAPTAAVQTAPKPAPSVVAAPLAPPPVKREVSRSGTGFFINAEGLMVTSWHVVENAKSIAVTAPGEAKRAAHLMAKDATCDLAVLKVASGAQHWLPINRSIKKVRRGSEVMTVGFPRVNLQGAESKVTNGLISSLSGVGNDAKFFQISVPIQPGNSGGPLVSREGSVVGVVSGKLAAQAALDTSLQLPENVNYAVKSSCLWDVLRTLPGKHRYDVKRVKGSKAKGKGKAKATPSALSMVDLTERVEKTVALVTVSVE